MTQAFKHIETIDDVRPFVSDRPEIRFHTNSEGVTVGCYMFADSGTFETPEALECRGIAFGPDGRIISRPLHKFFNLGERTLDGGAATRARRDVSGIFDKLDGSMIATAMVGGKLRWRSKKVFDSDVARLAHEFVSTRENERLRYFAESIAYRNMTAIFELTHPHARIVVAQEKPAMRLLHIRHNITGAYVMLDPDHPVYDLISYFDVPLVRRRDDLDMESAIASLADLEDAEGYIAQFADGSMIKMKCPWYLRLHRAVSMLRERDVATLALEGGLDDLKAALAEAGTPMGAVLEVETRLKEALIRHDQAADALCAEARDKGWDRKAFALAHSTHPLFSIAVRRFAGQEVDLTDWYRRTRLKEDFQPLPLVSGALAEALEG